MSSESKARILQRLRVDPAKFDWSKPNGQNAFQDPANPLLTVTLTIRELYANIFRNAATINLYQIKECLERELGQRPDARR